MCGQLQLLRSVENQNVCSFHEPMMNGKKHDHHMRRVELCMLTEALTFVGRRTHIIICTENKQDGHMSIIMQPNDVLSVSNCASVTVARF